MEKYNLQKNLNFIIEDIKVRNAERRKRKEEKMKKLNGRVDFVHKAPQEPLLSGKTESADVTPHFFMELGGFSEASENTLGKTLNN